ncbi:MAG: DUF3467 domain-containing protein [Planctomycetes bacterium]|nr:DUF3467 domain-containing protein [Planctomycetota bacterium]
MIFGEEDSQGPDQHQRVQLDTVDMETIYANMFALAGSPDEIVLYLGANSPLPKQASPSVKISHRIILLPQNAKRLMIGLQQTIKAHEERFGPIELPPPPRPQGLGG